MLETGEARLPRFVSVTYLVASCHIDRMLRQNIQNLDQNGRHVLLFNQCSVCNGCSEIILILVVACFVRNFK